MAQELLDAKTLSEIREGDVKLLLDLQPSIKIVNKSKDKPKASLTQEDGYPVEMKTDCGWTFHYYPATEDKAAWAEVSAGFAKKDIEEQVTLQVQVFKTAIELIDFLTEQGWDKFKIEKGSPLFQWAVWACLDHRGQSALGYQPSADDKRARDRSKYLFDAKYKIGVVSPAPQASPASSQNDEESK